MANDHEDFGRLYRAAFAECDPEKKSLLLKEVQRALQEWEQTTDSFMAASDSPQAM
jgi:hypothetical protein